MQTITPILTPEQALELQRFAESAQPSARGVYCIGCRSKMLPRFTHCHNCDENAFYNEAADLGVYGLLDWMENQFDDREFYIEAGQICLEYYGPEERVNEAATLLQMMGIDCYRTTGKVKGIWIWLQPGERFRLKQK